MAAFTWTPAVIIERLGGDEEMAHELVSLFVAEYPNMIEAVRTSVAGGSGDQVRRAAHALKGSVANFLDDGPRVTAMEIEEAGREGRSADAAALLPRLEDEMEQLLREMRAFEQA